MTQLEFDSTARGMFMLKQSDTIHARVLAANVAEEHTIPSGAKYVVFSATEDFYCKMDAAAAVPSGDVTDGTASELNPAVRSVIGVTTIGLISESACIITMAFYA